MVQKNESRSRTELLLVEFKAPRDLVDAFDAMLKSRFSNRSEAIRSLMRTFVEAASRRS
jgi:metal-responsive CopG/Arc/MetJ family transcriptional regulator